MARRSSAPVRPQAESAAPVAPPQKPNLVLLVVCGAALAARLINIALEWRANPFAAQPVEDAEVYWNWAGEIARGKLLGDTPFFSAPLYPYLVGLLRATGGGLLAVYGLQAGLHTVTLAFLGHAAQRRFGARAAWLSALVFALLSEPAYFVVRILAPTLQAFLIAAWIWHTDRPTARRGWGPLLNGLLLGLNVLANPPALLLIPVAAILIAQRPQAAAALSPTASIPPRWSPARGLLVASAAFLTIAPATLHNALAGGGFILVSAQSGITMAQGNAPGADGTYTVLPGVDQSRLVQNLSAARVVERQTGAKPSWPAVDRYWRDQALRYWADHPGPALALEARKLAWFFAGMNYGDIYVPRQEALAGIAPGAWLAPLPTPFLIPAALFGLLALPAVRRFVPAWSWVALGLMVVALFYYSPRYRFPAVPALGLLCGVTVGQLLEMQGNRVRRAACGWGCIMLGPLALSLLVRASGFDSPAGHEAAFSNALANVLARSGDAQRAEDFCRRALQQRPDNPAAAGQLALLLARRGAGDEARGVLEPVLRAHPDNASLQGQFAFVLLNLGRGSEALAHMRRAAELNPDDPRLRNNFASALVEQGQLSEARTQLEIALRLRPDYPEALVNLARVEFSSGHVRRAIELCQKAVRISPELPPAWRQLGESAAVLGDFPGAIAAYRQALKLNPDDADVQYELIWWQAVAPGLDAAARADALRQGQSLAARAPDDFHVADALAAAWAANGRFAEALQSQERALDLARRDAHADVHELEARRALYAAGRPFIIAPTGSSPTGRPTP